MSASTPNTDGLRASVRSDAESSPGTPRLLRTINERALLNLLRRHGPRSRAQLARDTGLSKPTVSQALANLERAGLVNAAGRKQLARGRSAMLYEPNARAAFVVGIDIGTAWIRVAVADLSGALLARRDARNRARTSASVVRAVAALNDEVLAEAGLTRADVAHTVVGSPGTFDPSSGRLVLAPNLPGWERPGLIDAFRKELSPTVALHNDANLAALGERSYGQGAGVDTFVFVMIGTGVGMGIIIDGQLYEGVHGMAGEIAFLPLTVGDETDRPLERGILEETISADGVVQTARELGMTGTLSAKGVFAAARNRDPLASQAVAREGERLARLVASIAAMLDPQLVILGGGVGRNGDLLRVPLERELERLTPIRPVIAESTLGDDVIVLGAVATALDRAHEIVFEQRAGAVS
jgi:predicted NBD/HSP70 family sugar kinase